MVLIQIFNIILLLVVAILVHELGHWIWFYRNKGLKFNLQFFYDNITSFGLKSVWDCDLTPEERMNSLLFGIFAGLFVVVIAMLSSQHLYLSFALPLYMVGCNDDLHKLIEIIKEKGDLSEFHNKNEVKHEKKIID